MDVNETTIDATTDDGEMAVVVTQPSATPEGDAWPTVVLFIDAPGLRPATRQFMARMAGQGYRVVTPDLHHRQGRLLYMEPPGIAAEGAPSYDVRGWIGAMTDEQIQHDMDRALDAAGVADDAPLATIGFCLGARAVVKAMERMPERVVAGAGWHPSFLADDKPDSPHRTAHQLASPLYLGIGEADEIQSIEMHRPFLDAVADMDHIEVVTFPGADHGFTWPGYPNYDENAAETSWAKTLAMFEQAFE